MIVQRTHKKTKVKKMKTKYPVRTEREVVASLGRRRYKTRQQRGFTNPEPVLAVRFTTPQGVDMKAWRSKHAVHMKRISTNVRATMTFNLQRTRTVDMKQSDYAKWSAAQLKAECKARDLKVGGTKAVLTARLIDNDATTRRGEEE